MERPFWSSLSTFVFVSVGWASSTSICLMTPSRCFRRTCRRRKPFSEIILEETYPRHDHHLRRVVHELWRRRRVVDGQVHTRVLSCRTPRTPLRTQGRRWWSAGIEAGLHVLPLLTLLLFVLCTFSCVQSSEALQMQIACIAAVDLV